MKLLPIAFLLTVEVASPSPLAATVLFQPAVHFACGHTPIEIAILDVDRDGIPDVVTLDRGDSSLSILHGRGGGWFGPRTDWPVGRMPSQFAVGDLNEDSWPDFVVTQPGGRSVSLILSQGKDLYAAPVVLHVARVLSPVALADFNGDGHLDLAVSETHTEWTTFDSILVFPGDGTGRLGVPAAYAAPTYMKNLTVADLNGDGHADLLSFSPYDFGCLGIFLNDGHGGLLPFQTSFNSGVGAALFSALALDDVTDDGILDVVFCSLDHLGVDRGLGGGGFQCVGPVWLATPVFGVVTGDWNDDGKVDVALAGQGECLTFLGHGDGTFGDEQDYAIGGRTSGIACGDLDGDGFVDLALAEPDSDRVAVLLHAPPTVTAILPHHEFYVSPGHPNPSRDGLWVSFSLPDDAAARLEAFDVAGHRMAEQAVGVLGAGRHRIRLVAPGLRAGVYLIRLEHGSDVLRTKASVLR
jgi:hypothetical protein